MSSPSIDFKSKNARGLWSDLVDAVGADAIEMSRYFGTHKIQIQAYVCNPSMPHINILPNPIKSEGITPEAAAAKALSCIIEEMRVPGAQLQLLQDPFTRYSMELGSRGKGPTKRQTLTFTLSRR